MTLSTLPDGIIRNIYEFVDPRSGYALSAAERRTQNTFLSTGLLEKLIGLHFHCAPSPHLSPIDHHLALTTSLSKKTFTVLPTTIMKINGPPATILKVSSDLKQGLSVDGEIFYLWNLPEGRLAHTFAGHASPIQKTDQSADGSWGFTKSSTEIKIWDFAEKICSKTITKKEMLELEEIKIRPSHPQILSLSLTQVQLWDPETETVCLTIACEETNFNPSLYSISADGNTLLVSLENRALKLYSLVTGKCLQTIEVEAPVSIDSLTMNDRATKAYTVFRGFINIWDLENGTFLESIVPDCAAHIKSLKISPDGNKIIANYVDGTINVWHHDTKKCIDRIYAPEGTVQCEQISSDGTQALLVHGQFNSIQYLNLAPLPHALVADAVSNCLRWAPEKTKQYPELHRFIRGNTPPKVVWNSPYQSNIRIYQDLCDYSTYAFLPRIKKFLELTDLAKSAKDKACYLATAYHRFSQLPQDVQNPIYNKMSLFFQALGKSETDGRKAFHDNAVSNATKVLAIEAPLTMRTEKQAEKFLHKRSLEKQRMSTRNPKRQCTASDKIS